MNHFARCCRSKPIRPPLADNRSPRPPSRLKPPPTNSFPRQPPPREIHHVTDAEQCPISHDEYLFRVTISQVNYQTTPKAKVVIANVPLQVLIDSGASINIIDEKAYHAITKSPQNKQLSLRPTLTKIYSYGGTSPLSVLGTFSTHVASRTRVTPATIYVLKGENGCLLSYKTANELELISVIAQTDTSVSSTTVPSALSSTQLRSECSDLFDGIGKMKDFQVHHHIDPSVPPVTQPHRRIPFHLRKKLDTELDKLERQGIIEPVDGPAPWVSPLVVTPKPKNPDEIRLCVHMRQPNRAILCERHIAPTIDDLIHDLNGATVFSKIDLNSGYHKLELAPESRYTTTFSSVFQRYYSQTEREALGVLFACEHFHISIHGAKFTIITDHKPLERIFTNPAARSNARLERSSFNHIISPFPIPLAKLTPRIICPATLSLLAILPLHPTKLKNISRS